MAETKQERPRMITLLTVLLLLETLLILFLGLNLLTDHWTFLFSWPVFREEMQQAYFMVISTPGEMEGDEILFYNVIAFAVLTISAGSTLISGLSFRSGGAVSWIMGLLGQIGLLMTGIGLYFIYRPSQAYWLLVAGILMVLYLNYEDVRQWFLQSEQMAQEELND